MKILVKPHKVEILQDREVNEKEIDVSKCEFEFDNEITNDFVKEAYFTLDGNTYKQIIINNECAFPSEVLEHKGDVELGVVAFKVENEEEIKRYNPSPAYFNTWMGSLRNAENSEPITPSDKEQIEQAILNLQNNKQDTLISGENIKTLNNESLLGSGNIEIEVDLSDYYTKEETYSKGEVDNLIPDLTNYVKNTNYASASKGGVIKSGYYGLQVDSSNGKAYCDTYTYANYGNVENQRFISKGTLENVITGKELVNKTYVDDLVGDIETILTTLDIGGGISGN